MGTNIIYTSGRKAELPIDKEEVVLSDSQLNSKDLFHTAQIRFFAAHADFCSVLDRVVERVHEGRSLVAALSPSDSYSNDVKIYFARKDNSEGSLYLDVPKVAEGLMVRDVVRFRWIGTTFGHHLYLNGGDTFLWPRDVQSRKLQNNYLQRHEGFEVIKPAEQGIVAYSRAEFSEKVSDHYARRALAAQSGLPFNDAELTPRRVVKPFSWASEVVSRVAEILEIAARELNNKYSCGVTLGEKLSQVTAK